MGVTANTQVRGEVTCTYAGERGGDVYIGVHTGGDVTGQGLCPVTCCSAAIGQVEHCRAARVESRAIGQVGRLQSTEEECSRP